MRASFWVIGAAGRAHGRGARCRCRAAAPSARGRSTCSSWRSRRSAPRSRSTAATSSPRAQERPQGRRDRVPQGHGRRHPHRADGGVARRGRHRDRERGARARDRATSPTASTRWAPRSPAPAPRRSSSRASPSCDGARHRVLPDRIETGTYAMAVAMTGGDVLLRERARGAAADRRSTCSRRPASTYTETNDGMRVARNGGGARAGRRRRPQPFPGFPTDLQAQLMALMTRADGTSRITETIFENRFMHVQELARLGAHIQLDGETRDHRGRRARSRARR